MINSDAAPLLEQYDALLHRVIVPERLALICRGPKTVAYNPRLNTWALVTPEIAEVIRWIRAGRPRAGLAPHLSRRFDISAGGASTLIREGLQWCILRRILYIESPPPLPGLNSPAGLSTVYWITTQACNLRCTYCYQDAAKKRSNELSTEEARSLIDQAASIGADTFVFTGGEPFSRRDLLPLAKYAKGKNLRVNVITNGSFISSSNISEIASTFDRVAISLDHLRRDHHDAVRGHGSWEAAVRAIELLLCHNVAVDVNSVLSASGLQHLDELLELGAKWRIGDHRVVPRFPIGRGQDEEGALSAEQLLALSDRMREQRMNSRERQGPSRMEGESSEKGALRNHCGAGLSEVSVDPEGWVYACKLLQYPMMRTSNIRHSSLAEIYNNHPILQRTRSSTTAVMKPCSTCIIRDSCGGGCRGFHFARTRDYSASDPLFCAFLRQSFETSVWASTGEAVPSRDSTYVTRDDGLIPALTLSRKRELQ